MLSFIVPVYKPKSEVFEKCVKALRDQALKDFEVIFVLDGPSADARRIIAKNMAGSFQVFEIEHAGAQAARNYGGTKASGDFLCFFDSDCVIEPGTSKMWMDQFVKHPEIGFIYSGYKFFGDRFAIESESFDPFTLRVRNYISGCFPMRKELYPGWTEGIESLQDWDMWLSLIAKAHDKGWDVSKLGFYVPGYAFATSMPTPESISGQGCTADKWLERVDAVKRRHHLPERSVCVTSLQYKHDGVALAKLINADYQDAPHDKPHRYKTIIQVGFSMGQECEKHAAIFGNKTIKKILFWTGDNINEMYNNVSFKQIDAMCQVLNDVAIQYAEDDEAQRLLARAGFKAEVMPLPLGKPNILAMPIQKKWAVDIAGDYSQVLAVIERSLPDIPFELVGAATRLADYQGLIHFFPDKTVSSSIKRAHLMGRHVISNVQAPFCGFIDDKWDQEKFIVETVDKVRELSGKNADPEAPEFYATNAEKLLEVA